MKCFLLLFFGLSAGIGNAQQLSVVQPFSLKEPVKESVPHLKLWRISLTAVGVANAMDIHSSWGKYELNKHLASSNGTFGRDGALLKLASQGGLLAVEYLITRGHPTGKLYKSLAVINFGTAATIGAVAAHNYTVPRPK